VRYTRSDDMALTEPVLNANGLVAAPVPFAYFVEGIDTRIDPRNTEFEARAKTYTVALGARPVHDVSVFLYANRLAADVNLGKPDETGQASHIDGSVERLDAGARFAFSATQALWVKAGASREDSRLDQSIHVFLPNQALAKDSSFRTRPEGNDVALRYTARVSEDLELTAGAEAARLASPRTLQQDANVHFVSLASPQQFLDQSDVDTSKAVHAAARFGRGTFSAEAGLAWRDYRKDRDVFVASDQGQGSFTDNFRKRGADPFAGLVWKPAAGLTGRFACRRWVRPAALDTLQAVAVAGIPVEDQLVFPGGDLRQCRAQAEWTLSPQAFLEAHVEEARVRNLVSALDGVQNTRADVTNLDRLRNRVLTPPTRPDELEDTPVFGQGRARRLEVAYERTLGRSVGMRVHYEYADAKNTDPAFEGRMIPWIPRQRADLGLTWAPGWHTFVTVAGAWRSRRFSDEANATPVPAGWDARVNVFIESADKRWALEAYGFNLLKKETSDAFGLVASWRF
jgi:hypothetical protein